MKCQGGSKGRLHHSGCERQGLVEEVALVGWAEWVMGGVRDDAGGGGHSARLRSHDTQADAGAMSSPEYGGSSLPLNSCSPPGCFL
jgi:hypothetical protein